MLGRGMGVNTIVVAVSAAVGPPVAAAILAVASWPWLFAISVRIGAVALVAARTLPRTPGAARRFDIVSALLNALFFGLLIVALDGAGHGEGVLGVALEAAVALLAGVALLLRHLPPPPPFLPAHPPPI